MRHNDYMVIKNCQFCGKPVLRPVFWAGLKSPMTGKASVTPTYPMCKHIKDKWR